MAQRNPFFVGGPVPPTHFKGRESDLNVAFDQIFNNSHLALYGEPGIGKSSYLKALTAPDVWKIRGEDPDKLIKLHINCRSINPFTAPAFWREVLTQLKEEATDNTLKTEIDKQLQAQTVGNRDMREALRQIGNSNKRLLLLLDDFDDAALHSHTNYTEADMLTFLYEMRSLAVYTPEGKHLSIIVTSFRRLDVLGPKSQAASPWYNQYLFRPLKPFTNTEITVLLSCMPAQWSLTSEQKEGIQEIAGGHPALLQNACNVLYNLLRAGDQPGADPTKLMSDFLSGTEHFFRNMWTTSNEGEQMLMMLIALSRLDGRLNNKRTYNLSDIDTILSQMDRELRVLEERGLIQRKEEKGKYICDFSSSIMEWWVIKEIENSQDEVELQQRERIFFNLSRKQADQIKNVIRDVWRYKDAITSVVGWTGKLVGAFTKGLAGGGD